MRTLDLRKQLKHLYQPSAKEAALVDVPEMQFLMVDGEGGPGTSEEFQAAVQALYGLSYTLKFTVKKGALAVDYPVMALEGLWWMEGGAEFDLARRDLWRWTLMIMQPDLITAQMVAEATVQVQKKRPSPALPQVRFEPFHEGLSVQTMHIGPYAEEPATIEKLHTFARDHGYELRGKHHEIYLSDPRRAKPERMKTVIRQPVSRM